MKEIQKAMALAMVLALAIVVVFGAVGTSDSDLSAEEPFSIPDGVNTINVTSNGSTSWNESNTGSLHSGNCVGTCLQQ